MFINELQTAVLDRLTGLMTDVKCELFPEGGSYKLNNPNGAILIFYSGADFDLPDSRNVQRVRHNIALTVIAKNLHNNNGVLSLVAEAKEALSGWSPRIEGIVAERSYYSRFSFNAKEKDGAWHYGLDLVVVTIEMV